MFRHPDTRYYYAGDLDYAGVAIYLNLSNRYQQTHRLTYLPRYFDHLISTFERKQQKVPTLKWPALEDKDKKHQVLDSSTYQHLIPNERYKEIEIQLAQGRYLPQEVMSFTDWFQQLMEMEVTPCTHTTQTK